MFAKIKLKWRIFGFLLGFCILLLVFLWLSQIVFLNDFYRYFRISEVRNDVSTIVYHIDDEDINEIVDELSVDGDFVADIVDMQGNSLLNGDRQGSRQSTQNSSANIRLITSATRNAGEYYRFTTTQAQSRERRGDSQHQSGGRNSRGRNQSSQSQTESLLYVRIIDERAIIVNAVISPVHATTTALRYQLFVISGVMIILSAILAIIIARRVSKPIEDINDSAMNLAKGQYDTRFNGKGFYEIAGLSETLNTTAIELGRAETLRRELLANVSHDLRTPLSLIYSYAEMMRDFPEDITPEQAETIMEETKRLSGLVNDVLEISKLEAGMEQLNKTRFNLTKNIDETVELMRELLSSQGYTVEFTHGEDIFVEADEAKINSAFYNLLVNAINHAGADQKVIVELTTLENAVTISVTDYGNGISDDDLPFIWDRYYKSKTAHRRAVTGTGLGLSIVKKIIEMHKGSYGVTTNPGKGSTFWITLYA
ncbi:MAG: HAMP domain-containing histidine kinase [Oscillospiraceae bacterium]|nr:HAMP domain-containing histidine kinase [Oscillospiraceae bacterium]